MLSKIIRRPVISGFIVSAMLFASITAGAKTINLYSTLESDNPFYSSPKGRTYTSGYKRVTAKCTVSKKGYDTKCVGSSNDKGGAVETRTDWIYGPTFVSEGTKFVSYGAGYGKDNKWKSVTHTKKY